jgi:hypothetical protein
MAHPVADELCDQERNRVIEGGQTPFSQRCERETTSFGSTGWYGRQLSYTLDAEYLPRYRLVIPRYPIWGKSADDLGEEARGGGGKSREGWR